MDGLMQELVERASAYVRAVNSQRNDELMLADLAVAKKGD